MEAATKAQRRALLLASRRSVAETVHQAEAEALAAHAATLVSARTPVCAYVPIKTEPGSIALLDALSATGVKVLLPVSRTDAHGDPLPLWWSSYSRGELIPAAFGLLEPAGEASPPATIAEAQIILVPALAVDRRGVRLGRGAGFYDRSLPLRNPIAKLIAVVRDEELLDELPGEPHDVPMTHALTPGNGLVELGSEAGMRTAE